MQKPNSHLPHTGASPHTATLSPVPLKTDGANENNKKDSLIVPIHEVNLILFFFSCSIKLLKCMCMWVFFSSSRKI